MLYDRRTRTLIRTVAPGQLPSVEELRNAAALKGRAIDQGPVVQVAFVFMVGREAQPLLPEIRRLGLECRAFNDNGVEEVVVTGTRIEVGAQLSIEGELLPVLREERWDRLHTTPHRRLLPGTAEVGPWVTFGFDTSDRLAVVPTTDERPITALEKRAIANLGARAVTVREMMPGTIAVEGEYAIEAVLLLPSLARELDRELGGHGLVVAAPKAGPALVTSMGDVQGALAMVQWTREQFDAADGRRVSPLPLLVTRGRVVGFVSPEEVATQAGRRERPWWRFW